MQDIALWTKSLMKQDILKYRVQEDEEPEEDDEDKEDDEESDENFE